MSNITLPLLTICRMDAEGKLPLLDCLQSILGTELPARTGYWLEKIRKVVHAEVSTVDEHRTALIRKLGTEEEPGKFRLEPEAMQEFHQEMESLQHDVELPMDADLKLSLPKTYVPEDWRPITDVLDIFHPPEE